MSSALLTRARAEAGRLKRRIVPTGVVLMYHRIAEVEADPWDLTVSPRAFEQQLQMLRANGVHLMTAAELAVALADQRLPKRCAVITFDDGYLDNLTAARPLLERHDAPATVFVAAGEVGRLDGFWWERLGAFILNATSLPDEFTLGGERLAVSALADDRLAVTHLLWKSLVEEEPQVRDEKLAQIAGQVGGETQQAAGARIVNEDELRRLGDGGLVEIASHGWSHRPLAELPKDTQRDEASRSRKRLEEIMGAPVTGMSYPHGSRGEETRAIVREAGYAYACGSRPGLVRGGADLFDLPRMEVRDTSPDEFERFLADHVLS